VDGTHRDGANCDWRSPVLWLILPSVWESPMATAADRKPVPESLIDKIAALPDGRVAEVEDFVDFLRQREAEALSTQALRTAAMAASAASFAAVWNSPEDDVYDSI